MPPVWGDRKRIGQVLSILLSNAIKFTASGGMVQVHAETRDDGGAVLAVTDTGIGIPPAFRRRVFDKFFQIDSSLSRRYEGAGIGLSIAKNIAEAHGGTIELESTPNEGSTFTLVLPRATFVPGPATGSLRNIRAVCGVENPDFRDALSGFLASTGCRITLAEKGYESVRLTSELRPDVLIIDEALSDVSGAAAIARMRQEPSGARIPAILLKDVDARPDGGVSPLDTATHILAKPFTPEQLVAAIRHVCLGEEARDSGPSDDQETQQDAKSGRARVLVVDNDADLLEWIEAALGRRKIACRCVADETEALDAARQMRPDVVFLDAELMRDGEMDLCSALRREAAIADVRIYVFTGVPSGHGEPRGVDGVLHKPFSIREMTDLILNVGTSVT
jgi:DNA-binding response OmpR family regulator